MPKSAHLHIVLESKFLQDLKEEAKEKGIRLSELCRQKLSKNYQLDRIERMLREALQNGKGE